MRIAELTKHNIKDISTLCVDSFLDGEYSYYLQKCNLSGLDNFIDFCSVQNLESKFDGKHIFLGAFDQNTLIATACVNISIGNILLLFVDKDYQGQGIGKSLMTEIEKVAKEKSLKRLTVDSTHFAVDFYKSCGYTIITNEQILPGGLIFTTLAKKL